MKYKFFCLWETFSKIAFESIKMDENFLLPSSNKLRNIFVVKFFFKLSRSLSIHFQNFWITIILILISFYFLSFFFSKLRIKFWKILPPNLSFKLLQCTPFRNYSKRYLSMVIDVSFPFFPFSLQLKGKRKEQFIFRKTFRQIISPDHNFFKYPFSRLSFYQIYFKSIVIYDRR